jgi:hypothetical protein
MQNQLLTEPRPQGVDLLIAFFSKPLRMALCNP